MAKKNPKPRKLVEEIEPFEPQQKSTGSESTEPQQEPVPTELNPEDVEESLEVSSEAPEASTEQPDSVPEEVPDPTASAEEESPEEDPLADVRQTLIEEETLEKEKQPKWWRRISRGLKKDKAARPAEPVGESEVEPPVFETPVGAVEQQEGTQESEEYLEQIDELIDMLEPGTEAETPAPTVDEEVPVPQEPAEPVHKVDIEELKKQAFQPRTAEEPAENISDVRSIALEGEEEVFVEVEAKAEDPLQERLKAFENAIKPYRRYINIAFAFLGLVMAVIAGLLLYNVYQQVQPEPTPAVVSNLPFPTSVSLPGGWSFSLGRGALQDGRWNPQGAEWLEGTEVCRWVALPWSRQLEAVIRTLNPDDPIELTMSNNDMFVYRVYSVRQLTSEEMLDLDSNTPCLLLVLAEADTDSRWVLTALP